MKVRFSLLVLIFSVLFFSCSNNLDKGEGSVALDVSGVARYIAQNSARAGGDPYGHDPYDYDDGYGEDGKDDFYAGLEGIDIYSFFKYVMTIRAYTNGSYFTSSENVFEMNSQDMQTPEQYEAFYTGALSAPIILDGIPAGSFISVTLEIGMGARLDEGAFRQAMMEAGMPEEYIMAMIQGMQNEMHDEFGVAGMSEEFTVKPGENFVTIYLGMIGYDEYDKYGGREGIEEKKKEAAENEQIQIILYSRSSGSGHLTAYSLFGNGRLVPDNNVNDESFVNFTVNGMENTYWLDSSGKIFYSNSMLASVDELDTSTSINIGGTNCTTSLLSMDENGQVLFYGATKADSGSGRVLCLKAWPGDLVGAAHSPVPMTITSYDDTFGYQESEVISGSNMYKSDISDIPVFTVFLGMSDSTQDPDTFETTLSYNDAYLYIVAKYENESGGAYAYDYFFSKIPMNFSVVIDNTDVTADISLDKSNIQTFKLSDFDPIYGLVDCWINEYKYSITDMTVSNGYLYALLCCDRVNAENKSFSPINDPFNYPIESYGAILKIDPSNFNASGVEMIGNNILGNPIPMPQETAAGDSTPTGVTINFNITQPMSEDADGFFGPRKFIALRPDKLVIADDGTFYYEKDGAFCFKNIDRAVVFDPFTNELTAYSLNMADTVKFEKDETSDLELTITGCGSTTYAATCQYRP